MTTEGNTANHLVLLCREGFEAECAAEIQHLAEENNTFGYCRARPNQGFVQYCVTSSTESTDWMQNLATNSLIFARQIFCANHDNSITLNTEDRVSSILGVLDENTPKVAAIQLHTADTNDGRELSVLAKKLQRPLQAELERRRLWKPKSQYVLNILLTHTDKAIAGVNLATLSSQWLSGIPRLKRPRQAPSRSTLKLEEAIKQFELEDVIKPGMTGVDLGAAPGGWTYQLAKRDVKVYAVDNGPLSEELAAHPMVQHIKADGFRYRPPHQVDWLICDMVEQPKRVMDLMIQWLATKTARAAVFNLKLPMKRRWLEVQTLMQNLEAAAQEYGNQPEIQAKHLYHDREEITVYCRFRS